MQRKCPVLCCAARAPNLAEHTSGTRHTFVDRATFLLVQKLPCICDTRHKQRRHYFCAARNCTLLHRRWRWEHWCGVVCAAGAPTGSWQLLLAGVWRLCCDICAACRAQLARVRVHTQFGPARSCARNTLLLLRPLPPWTLPLVGAADQPRAAPVPFGGRWRAPDVRPPPPRPMSQRSLQSTFRPRLNGMEEPESSRVSFACESTTVDKIRK